MKKIDKNAYTEKRHDKSHLMILGLIVFVISIAMIIGGVVLFVKGVKVDGVWSTIWRIALGVAFALLGGTFGWVSIMLMVTAGSMINVKDGNVSDIGNSAMGTVNINKCSRCGTKLDADAEFCTNCGASVEATVKCGCGCINSIDAQNCKKCGKSLK